MDFGASLSVALPTGDEDALLGVGAVRVNPGLIASMATGFFAAHTNVAFHADTEDTDRNRFDYSVGGELRVTSWLTALVDHVGRIEMAGDDLVKFEIVPGIKVNPYADFVLGFNAFVPLNREGADD